MDYFIAILAVWKLSEMMVNYDGPLDIFSRLRTAVDKYQHPKYRLFNFECWFCISTWVTLPFAFLFDYWFMAWLAIAGGAALIEYILDILKR